MEQSAFGRILTVFTSPEATFRSIAERPTWLAPLVVFLLVSTLLGVVVHQRTDYREFMEWSFEQQEREMSAEQMEQAIDITERFAWVGVAITPFLATLILLLMAVLHWAGLKLFGGELTFKQAWSTYLYSLMPVALMSVIGMLLLWPRGTIPPEQLSTRTFVASNLGFLAPEDAGVALQNALASLDFFALWSAVLMVIGFRIVARVSTGVATAVVAVLFLLGVAVRIGFAMLGGG